VKSSQIDLEYAEKRTSQDLIRTDCFKNTTIEIEIFSSQKLLKWPIQKSFGLIFF